MEAELRHDTVSWDCLVHSFMHTFYTNDVCPALDAAIRIIHTKVFDDQEVVEHRPNWTAQEAHAVECYNFSIDKDEDPRNIDIPESEGCYDVHGPAVEALEVTQPLKARTVNIGSKNSLRWLPFVTIGMMRWSAR